MTRLDLKRSGLGVLLDSFGMSQDEEPLVLFTQVVMLGSTQKLQVSKSL